MHEGSFILSQSSKFFGAQTQTNGVLGRDSSSRIVTMRSSDLGSPETREVGRGEGRMAGEAGQDSRGTAKKASATPTQEEAVGEVAACLNISAV